MEKRYNYDRKWKFEVELKVIDFISTCLCLLLQDFGKFLKIGEQRIQLEALIGVLCIFAALWAVNLLAFIVLENDK